MKLFNQAKRYAEENQLTQQIDKLLHLSHDKQYRESDEKNNHLQSSMSSHFEQGNTYRNEAISHLEQANSFRQVANWSKDNGVVIDSNADQIFIEWLANQPRPFQHEPMGLVAAEEMIVHQPDVASSYGEQFIQSKLSSYVSSGNAASDGMANVTKSYQSHRQTVSNQQATPFIENDQYNRAVDTIASEQGIDAGLAQPLHNKGQQDAIRDEVNQRHLHTKEMGRKVRQSVLDDQGDGPLS